MEHRKIALISTFINHTRFDEGWNKASFLPIMKAVRIPAINRPELRKSITQHDRLFKRRDYLPDSRSIDEPDIIFFKKERVICSMFAPVVFVTDIPHPLR